MIEQVAAALSSVKRVAPVSLMGIAIAASILLFAPERLAATLGVDKIRDIHRSEAGVALIGSVSYLAAHFFWWLRGLATRRRRRSAERRVFQGYLEELTFEERRYLAPFVVGEVTSQNFSMNDGIAGGLAAKRIIYRTTSIATVRDGFSYNIQPWARDYLRTHMHLLEGAVVLRVHDR